jgi:trans-aconitate methyltransferase
MTIDRTTIAAYDAGAAGFAEDWETQPAPADLHEVVRRFFAFGPTADIGCGSGRDTAWLDAHGYPATGFDASQGLLAEARRRHPGVRFVQAVLPQLDGVADASFANVLCETVIMHLPKGAVAASVRRLVSLLEPGGALYLSWRVGATDRRDEQGRLYAAVDEHEVRAALAGAEILFDEARTSASSGKAIRRLVARKASPADHLGGERSAAS